MGWAIALHGGARDISTNMPATRKRDIEAALQRSLDIGISALRSSHSAMDVVELVVRELENNPVFNAGRGSVLTTMGTVEMEASIMDGATMKCGAVSGICTVVNPISLARLVMEKTPHIYLAFDGAEEFAQQQGVETVDMSYFITQENEQWLQEIKAAHIEMMDPSASTDKIVETGSSMEERKDVSESNGPLGETVGCVVVDSHGHCAAATSTGGLVDKMVGRIGDTPLIGAGNYANHLCAVSATGIGELIIRATVARDVAALMEYKGLTLVEAVNEVIEKRLDKGTGGVVAVSNSGEIGMAFNTMAMTRACADENGHLEIGIWH